jgi:hypothetical protein
VATGDAGAPTFWLVPAAAVSVAAEVSVAPADVSPAAPEVELADGAGPGWLQDMSTAGAGCSTTTQVAAINSSSTPMMPTAGHRLRRR